MPANPTPGAQRAAEVRKVGPASSIAMLSGSGSNGWLTPASTAKLPKAMHAIFKTVTELEKLSSGELCEAEGIAASRMDEREFSLFAAALRIVRAERLANEAKAKLSERKTAHEWLTAKGVPAEENGQSICLLRRLAIALHIHS